VTTQSRFFCALIATAFLSTTPSTEALIIRGTGTLSLIGNDLTDPENDGNPEADVGYNAIFASSEEPGFGGAEAAFNVFDNQVGGGNAKWCCGDQNNFPTNPIWVQATFSQAFVLGKFTLTSGNDTPGRDPRVWELLGSNDGVNFTVIYSQNDALASLWTGRDQVLEFGGGVDFSLAPAFSTYRLNVTATGLTTGARFQLGEVELFNVPEPGTAFFCLAGMALGLSRRRRN
jgi:hypothetical protein